MGAFVYQSILAYLTNVNTTYQQKQKNLPNTILKLVLLFETFSLLQKSVWDL